MRAWRKHVGRMFGSVFFFHGLSRQSLPLWARVINAWLSLETPKAAMGALLARKTAWRFFTSKQVSAAHATSAPLPCATAFGQAAASRDGRHRSLCPRHPCNGRRRQRA